MRRFLRLLTLCLLALALPVQGAAAATAMAGHAAAPPMSRTMAMPNGAAMDAAAMPGVADCHRHGGMAKAGCGACCGPLLTQQAMLTVAPAATRWALTPRAVARAPATVFLTGGTDRPPRLSLA
jgi:hypothetical protein